MMFPKSGLLRKHALPVLLLLSMLSLLLVNCGGSSSDNQGGPTQITYTFLNSPTKDLAQVQSAINKVTIPKINVSVRLVPLDWGVFEQKVKLNFAAGVPCDLMWTAPWMNNYYQNVANGNFMALDDLLPKDAPDLWSSLSKTEWNAAKVNGKIYGAINQQIFYSQVGFAVRKDLADKYGLNVNNIHSYSDLEPFLQQVKDHEPGVTPVLNDSGHISDLAGTLSGIDQVGPGVGIRITDHALKAFDVYEAPEYKQAVEQARSWYQKGYIKDPDSQGFQNWDAGKYAVIVGQTVKPGGDNDFENGHPNYPIYLHAVTKPLLTTGSVAGTLTSVCRSSAHPDAAVKFLNELNSDPQVINLITYGIEGKEWSWSDKTHKVIKVAASPNYSTLGAWEFGNQFNAYYTNQAQVGAWDATKKANQSAAPSPALGFHLDTSTVKTQVASIATVQKQYFVPLEQGIVDPASGLPQAIQALKDAGISDVVTETQNEIDAWSKHK